MNCELLNVTSEIALFSSWLVLLFIAGIAFTAIGIVNITTEVVCKKWSFKKFFKNSILLSIIGVLFLIMSVQLSPRHIVKTFKIDYDNSMMIDTNSNVENNTMVIEAVYDENNCLIKINYIN